MLFTTFFLFYIYVYGALLGYFSLSNLRVFNALSRCFWQLSFCKQNVKGY